MSNFLERLKIVLFSSGLTKQEYALVEDRISRDNREKLASGTLLLSLFLFVMFALSLSIESISHSRTIYFLIQSHSEEFFRNCYFSWYARTVFTIYRGARFMNRTAPR